MDEQLIHVKVLSAQARRQQSGPRFRREGRGTPEALPELPSKDDRLLVFALKSWFGEAAC
jgi:hypothetical protein